MPPSSNGAVRGFQARDEEQLYLDAMSKRLERLRALVDVNCAQKPSRQTDKASESDG
ncbi:MAG: hypothetical protein AAGK33_13155 [Pseudomonadota bacterium]